MEHRPILPAGAPLDAAERFLPAGVGIEPLSAVARALSGFNRDQLGSAIEVLIAMLDIADGDPDIEADDRGGETVALVDDPDAPPDDEGEDPDLEQTGDEDDWIDHGGSGPGCSIADPGGAGEREDDEEDDDPGQSTEDEVSTNLALAYGSGPGSVIDDPGDVSWTEWHTRGRHKLHDGVTGPDGNRLGEDDELNGDELDGAWTEWCSRTGSSRPPNPGGEDAEDDDPAGQSDEDGVNTYFPGMDEAMGPGCIISDNDSVEYANYTMPAFDYAGS